MSKYNLTDIFEQYRIGSGYTRDFDYAGMLKVGLETGVDTDIEILKKISDDFEDVNYHRENNHLQMAIDALEEGAIKEASMFFGDFHAEIKSTMETFDMEIPDTLGAFMDSYIKEDAKDKDKEPRDGVKSAAAKLGMKPSHVKEDTKAVDLAIEASQEKAGINEVRIDRDVARRIEGLLNIQLKSKFLNYFEELLYDLLDDEEFYIDDVIAHLSNEMHKRVNGNQMAGDRLNSLEEKDAVNFDMKADADYDEGLEDIEEDSISGEDDYAEELSDKMRMKEALPKFKGVPPMSDIIKALKDDAKATDSEIKQFMTSVKKAGDEFDDVDDYVEDFKNYVADKALQEHFGRFMKDYQ